MVFFYISLFSDLKLCSRRCVADASLAYASPMRHLCVPYASPMRHLRVGVSPMRRL